ncbi:MAG: UDP-N-acetylmuramate--L-alanine ligase [Chitinispirillaceae bacterium]|nr:UDP-N-acetylmuramate--L-alanine ligase [Chitinispirillaceae bacterium]
MIGRVKERIHLVGIGGAGMSGLAELLHHYGYEISGSDRARSSVTRRLEKLGIRIQYDHTPALVKDARLLIYSSAVKQDNAERTYALHSSIPELRRADALGQIMRSFTTVCIAGTHGKTTTTSLVGAILSEARQEPTVLVGGTLLAEGAPVVIGSGPILVAEADEYDRSFLAMYPVLAIITTIEADHLDCYHDIDEIRDSFITFARRVPFYGAVICCSDDHGINSIRHTFGARTITYGVSGSADYTVARCAFKGGKASFDLVRKGEALGRIDLNLPGRHNLQNALGASAAALEMGASFKAVCTALEGFHGVARRFEIIGRERGVTVIDDYAHHPGEILATLDAARQCGFKRIIAVFQPHLYSRTRDFMDDFARSLGLADQVMVTAIYQAREEPIPGVSAESIVLKMKELGHTNALYCPEAREVVSCIVSACAEGDAAVFMGAGDITDAAHALVKELRNG